MNNLHFSLRDSIKEQGEAFSNSVEKHVQTPNYSLAYAKCCSKLKRKEIKDSFHFVFINQSRTMISNAHLIKYKLFL